MCMLSNAVKFSQEIHDVDVEMKIVGSRRKDTAGLLRSMLIIEVPHSWKQSVANIDIADSNDLLRRSSREIVSER